MKSIVKSAVICAGFLLAVIGIASCKMFESFTDPDNKNDTAVSISSLVLAKSTLTMTAGSMDYITVKVQPITAQKDCKLNWTYDSNIISCDTSSAFGVTIKALKEGQTSLRCSYGGYDATCIITVSDHQPGYEENVEPYIYSNTTILQTSPGITEKVFVSLYGGTAADIDGYAWSLDNTSVVNIQPTGQYCLITAKESGYARIKVTHNKASYPYYIGVYVFADATKVPYITTSTNILTMNQSAGEQTITCALVNGKDTSRDSAFKWEIVNQDSTEKPIGLSFNGNKAVITPLRNGSCTVRITHPDAPYPLDILCRVITIVKNVYIKPDNTIITLNGTTEQTVTCNLENINIGEYSIDEYRYALDNASAAEIVGSVGNQVTLRGLANGSTKLIITHPKAAYSREVLCIVTGQLNDAIDASKYITTSQNYIRTKVGAEPTTVSVSLKGGEDGDESGFKWSVKSIPSGGGNTDVIQLETTNGTAVHTRGARAAAPTYAYGSAHITPKAEGTAVISISHPKIIYTTEILVKVLNANAVLEEPLYFTGVGLLRIVNGQETECRIGLNGKTKSPVDEQNITWRNDDARITVSGNGTTAIVKAPPKGTGETISHITASHNKAEENKSILVLTADDEKKLRDMKAIYADKLYYNIEIGKQAEISCNAVGFDTYDEVTGKTTDYDYTLFSWTADSPIISITKNTHNPLSCTVQGLKAGSCKLTGSIGGYSCEFKITVYPHGTVQTEPEVYFTTLQNVITLKSKGKTTVASVTAVNLSADKHSQIVWKSETPSVATVHANGTNATITAEKEGESIITVTHPESQNTLKIYVRVGSEYVIPDTKPPVYVSAPDVLTMLRDDPAQKLQAVLTNQSGTVPAGFHFSIDNESVAKITAQSVNGIAYIKPVASGQAEVTITHTATTISKKVLVVVGNSSEELSGFVYLTTNNNVVAVGEGNTKTVSVSVKNSDSVVLDGYTWSSNNPAIVDITPSGSTAVLKGNSIGTAIITVKNKQCKYPLEIIAQCVDPIAAAANPYIQLNASVMTLTVGTTYTSITASLVGGTESDNSKFVWASNDSSICAIYGQNEVGKARAMKAGTTYITVSHPKAAYAAQILVVCDTVKESDCSISVPNSIITMKPTDAAQTITATLINGTAADKYNFTWSLDVYDIINFQYSANVCTITPKQTGTVTITISHPKAAYDQQIIVNVQQYSTFSFPNDSINLERGDAPFIKMQVPTTPVTTHIEYSVENSKICSITGIKTVAHLTAVGAGTTTIRARLIATSTGVEQARSEMMVYVKEKPVSAVYITAATTIYTVSKGKSQTLSATLTGTGVTTTDQYNLKWASNDSDVIQVTGINADGTVKGQSIYITALKAGEAVITCSHEKAASSLQFYVVVPGTGEKSVTLNKSYITMLKGSSGSPLKATIENAESNNDYNNLIWTCEGANGAEIARVMGNGQNVTIYPLAVGEATVMVQLPDSPKAAKCTVVVKAGKSLVFETNSRTVEPFHTRVLNYIVSPPDAVLTWTMFQGNNEDFFEYKDMGVDSEGKGQVRITGIKEGVGTIACVTDGGAKAQCTVRVAWDYKLTLGKTQIKAEPRPDPNNPDKFIIPYDVNPSDARIETFISSDGVADVYVDTVKKQIVLTPTGEGDATLRVTAYNTSFDPEQPFPNMSRECKLFFHYQKLNIRPSIISKTGSFSRYDENSGILIIGDGEEAEIGFGAAEQNANWTFTASQIVHKDSKSPVSLNAGSGERTYKITHPTDTVTQEYLVDRDCWFEYKGSRRIIKWQKRRYSTQDNWTKEFFVYFFREPSVDKDNNPIEAILMVYGRPRNIRYALWDNARYRLDCWLSDAMAGTIPGVVFRTQMFDISKRISKEEFEKNTDWYAPSGTLWAIGPFQDHYDHWDGADAELINKWAKKVDSNDKTVKNLVHTDNLVLSYKHNGKDKTVTIPIYTEIRNCPYNQQ
nr:hypothetical protein [Treponema socranskii]